MTVPLSRRSVTSIREMANCERWFAVAPLTNGPYSYVPAKEASASCQVCSSVHSSGLSTGLPRASTAPSSFHQAVKVRVRTS